MIKGKCKTCDNKAVIYVVVQNVKYQLCNNCRTQFKLARKIVRRY